MRDKEKVKAYNKQYRVDHKEEIKEYSRKYNLDNQGRKKKWYREWYLKNRERAKETKRQWNKKNPDKVTSMDLKKLYGIGLDDYKELLSLQDGVCAICKTKSKGKRRLCVDHDHETDEIRGLLCDNCNFALGHFKDNADLLLSAIEYLKETTDTDGYGRS